MHGRCARVAVVVSLAVVAFPAADVAARPQPGVYTQDPSDFYKVRPDEINNQDFRLAVDGWRDWGEPITTATSAQVFEFRRPGSQEWVSIDWLQRVPVTLTLSGLVRCAGVPLYTRVDVIHPPGSVLADAGVTERVDQP